MDIMTHVSRRSTSSLLRRTPYICNLCLHHQRTSPRPQSITTQLQSLRARSLHTSTSKSSAISPTPPQYQNPMDQLRAHHQKRNASALYYTISIILGTVALAYGSVPLYKTICQQMGWGGQPIKSPGHFADTADPDIANRLIPITDVPRLRITFNSSVSSILPWKFTPQQREVRVLPGETALAFYTATNTSDEDIIGVATYSVTPGQVAPYFSKIQCFCFEEQRLNAGETVDMPVFFYIDPGFVDDLNMRGIETVTLSYTFFKAKYDREGHLKPVAMG